MTGRLPADVRRILAAQALRAFGYGLGAVLLGVTLRQRGYSAGLVGLVLTAVVAGTVVASVLLARYADRAGRRRCYVVMYLLLGVAGVVFAAAVPLWVLLAASLTGALSTDVVESGPFTSLEQPMLAVGLAGGRPVAGFGLYNAVATAAGSLGALAAGLPGLLRARWARSWPRPASPSRWACRSCSPGSSRPATTSPCGRGSAPCRCPAPAAPALPGRRRTAVPPGNRAAIFTRLGLADAGTGSGNVTVVTLDW